MGGRWREWARHYGAEDAAEEVLLVNAESESRSILMETGEKFVGVQSKVVPSATTRNA